MPAYALPGTEVGPRRARILGACAVLLTVLTVVGWRVVPSSPPADDVHVALLVGRIGEGIAAGTDVRLDGVRVGSVGSIESTGPGRQRIHLTLNGSQLFGLTDALSVDYVPGNLFGISALELHSNSGGAVLADGSAVDLTAGDADRVQDATLAALLKTTGRLTDDVLTPKLSELLSTVSHDLSAFTPLLEAIGSTARSFAETQQLPPSLLFDRFGSTLTGLPPMLTGGLDVLHASYANDYLSSQEHLDRFGEMWTNMQFEILPVATAMLSLSQGYFGDLIPSGATLLDHMNASFSDPKRSTAQLSELLARLGAAFHDTPDGPVLDASVELGAVPGLATPLGALLGQHSVTGGGR